MGPRRGYTSAEPSATRQNFRELPRDTDVASLVDFYSAVISGMSLQAREGATRKTLLGLAQTAMRAWPEAPAKRVKKKAVHTA